MISRFCQRLVAIFALLVATMTFGCSGGDSSSAKAEKLTESAQDRLPDSDPKSPAPELSAKGAKPTESAKDRASDSDPKPPAPQPVGLIRIDHFLGISPDFTVYAASDVDGVKIIDLETGKRLTSPKWDRDWGSPLAAAFGKDVIAVVTIMDYKESVKIFSRKTGDLEQNVHGHGFYKAAFAADGRVLAIIEPRDGINRYLVLRDIQGKKTVAELRFGGDGDSSLAVAGKFLAAYESGEHQITVVEGETGKLVKKLNFVGGRMPLAISPAGDLLACGAEDSVVLYDIASERPVHKLEGHLDTVQALAFSPNGEIVVSAAKDKTIRFWNVKEGKEVYAIKNLPACASELIFSADGKRLAAVYDDEFNRASKAEIRSGVPK